MAKQRMNLSQPSLLSPAAPAAPAEVSYAGDKPNPHLRAFVERHAVPYDPLTDAYDVKAFTTPITTTKATAIYNMHTYWSKKPHDAIRQYVRHYTKPGDLVLDPFCGSGGTALAALMEGRKAVAIDRSPAATFITKNYCTPVDPAQLQAAFAELKRAVQAEMDWLYATRCDRCSGPATTGYTVYSQVFQCLRCLAKVALFDCVAVDGVTAKGKAKKVNVCPHCHANGFREVIRSQGAKFGSVPVLVSYLCQNGCKPQRAERRHDDADPTKRDYFERYDLGKLREIDAKEIPHWYPKHRMMNVEDNKKSWGEKWRAGTSSFRTVAELFTKRNLWALALIRDAATRTSIRYRESICFALNAITLNCSKMYRYRISLKGGIANGTYYVPQDMQIINAHSAITDKGREMVRGVEDIVAGSYITSCQSAISCKYILSNTVDYIFTDPPYSDTIQYGELNFVWEAWLGFDTTWHGEEIIVNGVRGQTKADWAVAMRKAMAECFRVLKPGRWLSLCYHDTSEGTWALVQDIMAEVGFVVDKTDTAVFIDAGQKSYNQLTADKVTKRDLVLNFRKPKAGDWAITRIYIPADADVPTFHELGRQVVRDFLTGHPGATKDRVYDALVSSMVRKRQMESHDFETLLRSVAEEVQQPAKKNLFDAADPDLFGSHLHSRWYLKETADQVDHAEQAKECDAAARLAKFVVEYRRKKPELEGVHYSDLFEQFLPVHDKPRRLLADWLPEFFIKTPGGTWRLPAHEEGEQLAKLREAGTLRRIKLFANALIDGVPVRDKDRPGSDANLLDWLRQCRRAGLYDQGKAIYETGGLNLANLSEEQQIEADDDFRICSRRGSTEAAKPKRQGRKKKGDGG